MQRWNHCAKHLLLRPTTCISLLQTNAPKKLSLISPPSVTFARTGATWPYLYSPKRDMAPQLDPYFKKVDELAESFIERLRKAVAIPSISAEDERRPDVIRVGLFQCPTAL